MIFLFNPDVADDSFKLLSESIFVVLENVVGRKKTFDQQCQCIRPAITVGLSYVFHTDSAD